MPRLFLNSGIGPLCMRLNRGGSGCILFNRRLARMFRRVLRQARKIQMYGSGNHIRGR